MTDDTRSEGLRAAAKQALDYFEMSAGDYYRLYGHNDEPTDTLRAALTASPQESPVNLPFPTTDASRWATEFVRLHGGDEGLMLAWFANAIEHGRGPASSPQESPGIDALPRFQMAEWPEQDFLLYEDVARLLAAPPQESPDIDLEPCPTCSGAGLVTAHLVDALVAAELRAVRDARLLSESGSEP